MTGYDTTAAIRDGHLQVLGLRTRVLEVGPADAEEAVVFIHGGGKSADDWADLLPRVGGFARGIAVDIPGFGYADKPADWPGYTAPGWASYIAAALDRLGVRRAHLVLHDNGGESGLTWAVAHPERFVSAVLINSGDLIDYRWHLAAKLHRIPVLGYLAAVGGRVGLGLTLRLYEPQLSKSAVTRWRKELDWGARRALLRYYRATPASGGGRLAPDLRSLNRPALVIWGAHNRFVPVEQAAQQRESFPRAEIVILDNTGHYTHLEEPQQVADLVVPFLHKQLSASAQVPS